MRARLIGAACLVLLAHLGANGEAASPTASNPPPPNGASSLADVLGAEVEALRRRAASAEGDDETLAASIAFRMISRELLVRGDAAPARDRVVIAGFRLADARGQFDAAAARAMSVGTSADPARRALASFASDALGSLRAAPPEAMLATTRSLLFALAPLLEAVELPPMTRHWPPILAEAATMPSSERSASRRVADGADEPGLDSALATAMRSLASKLHDAERWPDLAAEVEAIAAPLERLPSEQRSISEAAWIDDASRARLTATAVTVVEQCLDPAQRATAMRALAERSALVRCIRAISTLEAAPGSGPRDPLAPSLLWSMIAPMPSRRPDADAAGTKSSIDRLDAITELILGAAALRRLEAIEAGRDVRTLRRQMVREARLQDESIARQIASLAAAGGSPHDPAHATLLDGQRRRLRMLKALDGVDASLAEIQSRSMAPPSLNGRLRTQLQSLADPSRAPAALVRCESFVTQWRSLREHRTEVAIRAGDAIVIDRCAGRSAEVLAELDRRRSAWAQGWAVGAPEAGWNDAQQFLELLSVVDDAASLHRAGTDARLIGRWAGWDDLGGVPGSTVAIDGRLAIAFEAIARSDGKALGDALRVIDQESPLWRLRAAVLHRLEPQLAALPDGLSGALGRAADEPAPDAFLAGRAVDLARLGRLSRELLHAATMRDSTRREALETELRELATDLRRAIDEIDAGANIAPPVRTP